MNMDRCMLHQKKLSNVYWVEAILTIMHVLNRSPTTSLQDIVSQGTWDGKKVNASHFRIFGSVEFSHILEKVGKNLDDRSEMCIFIGYNE